VEHAEETDLAGERTEGRKDGFFKFWSWGVTSGNEPGTERQKRTLGERKGRGADDVDGGVGDGTYTLLGKDGVQRDTGGHDTDRCVVHTHPEQEALGCEVDS